MALEWQILYKDGKAKLGVIKTTRSEIITPVFMPVATKAALKSLSTEELRDLGFQIILSNTYHLVFKPGLEIIEKAGGVHKFMRWNRSLLTDSGGFQVFSLSKFRKITENGVLFKSYVDGKEHEFTPEFVVKAQRIIGSDIMMPLDVCLGYPADEKETLWALDMTMKWLERSLQTERDPHQSLFGIIQGGFLEHTRKKATNLVKSLPVDGYSIGGLAVGEPKDMMYDLIDVVTDTLGEFDKPVYLMGVGHPVDMLEAIERGVDMFDCVLPMRVARNGLIYTFEGPLKIKHSRYADDFKPIDERIQSSFTFLEGYTLAYLHHLFKTKELLGYRVATLINLAFMSLLMDDVRKHIKEGTFKDFKTDFINRWEQR